MFLFRIRLSMVSLPCLPVQGLKTGCTMLKSALAIKADESPPRSSPLLGSTMIEILDL